MSNKPTITQADRDAADELTQIWNASDLNYDDFLPIFAAHREAAVTELQAEVGDTQWLLTWTAAPRPPVHPSPMTGRQTFQTFNDAIEFFKRRPKDSRFVSLIKIVTKSIDRTNEARSTLAQKETGE